jgi:predicted RNA-binding protein with PIN domain
VLKGSTGWWIEVIFDAYKVKKQTSTSDFFDGVHVVYTSGDETADNYIERKLVEFSNIGFQNVIVATDDLAIREVAGSVGSGFISAEMLAEEIRIAYQTWVNYAEELDRESTRNQPTLASSDLKNQMKALDDSIESSFNFLQEFNFDIITSDDKQLHSNTEFVIASNDNWLTLPPIGKKLSQKERKEIELRTGKKLGSENEILIAREMLKLQQQEKELSKAVEAQIDQVDGNYEPKTKKKLSQRERKALAEKGIDYQAASIAEALRVLNEQMKEKD